MGNGLSVSNIVDRLHPLEPEARAAALDNLVQQHPETVNYLKSKYLKDPLPAASTKESRPSNLQVLYINESVPEVQKLSTKYASWNEDITSFWRSKSFTFMPEETSSHPLSFVYEATIRQQSENHESCLRSRFLALFWFDYFTRSYPGKLGGYDQDYEDLCYEVSGVKTYVDESVLSTLRDRVKAGRRYHKLTERFGNGILLIIPSSVGRSTLEQKLPLGDAAFEGFVSPLVGDWEKCAKTESIANVGASIRQSLLKRCPIQREESLSKTSSISSTKAAKRKARASPPKPKKQRPHPTNAMVRSRRPTTPRIWEQVYHLDVIKVSDATITDQTNKYASPPETAQATHVNSVTIHSQGTSLDQDTGSSTHLDNECTLHSCDRENLPLAAITGSEHWGAGEHAFNEPARQHQDTEGVHATVKHAPNQRATAERGEIAVSDRTEIIPQTRGNDKRQYEGKMLY